MLNIVLKLFFGTGTKKLKESMITVYLPSGRYLPRPILIDDTFIVDLQVRGLHESIANIKKANFNVAANYKEPILGLLGTDVKQFIKEFKTIDCLNGSAFSVGNGIIPFGDTAHFLLPNQICKNSAQNNAETNYKTIIEELPIVSEKSINFV